MPDFSKLTATHPLHVAEGLESMWSSLIVGEVNDTYIKVVKVLGSLAWHNHDNEDEMFLVLRGQLKIETDNENIVLNEGEMAVIPKGLRHNPVANKECLVMLVEHKSTLHTGNVVTPRTRTVEEQLPKDR